MDKLKEGRPLASRFWEILLHAHLASPIQIQISLSSGGSFPKPTNNLTTYGVLWTLLLSCFSYQTVTTRPTVNHQVNVHRASVNSVPVTDAVLGRRIPSAPLGPHGHCWGTIHAGTGSSLHSGHLVSPLLCGLLAVKSWMSSRHVIRCGSQGGRVHPIPPHPNWKVTLGDTQQTTLPGPPPSPASCRSLSWLAAAHSHPPLST